MKDYPYKIMVLILILVAAGCAAEITQSNEQAENIPSNAASPTATILQPTETAASIMPSSTLFQLETEDKLSPKQDKLFKAIAADLAARFDIEPESINLMQVEEVIWSNSSLGCPAPNQFYAQVETLGFVFIVEAGGEEYQYHTDELNQVVLCQGGEPVMNESIDNSQVETALENLAGRLAVNAESIDIISVEFVTWPNGGLGCPQPGMVYTQVPVDGILIKLGYQGQVYEYHGGGGRAPFLCEQPPTKTGTQTGDELLPPPDFDQ